MTPKPQLVMSAKAPTDQRVANAIEFMAQYIDRIDDHLEALAALSRANQAEIAKVASSMDAITQLLRRIAERR